MPSDGVCQLGHWIHSQFSPEPVAEPDIIWEHEQYYSSPKDSFPKLQFYSSSPIVLVSMSRYVQHSLQLGLQCRLGIRCGFKFWPWYLLKEWTWAKHFTFWSLVLPLRNIALQCVYVWGVYPFPPIFLIGLPYAHGHALSIQTTVCTWWSAGTHVKGSLLLSLLFAKMQLQRHKERQWLP